MVHHPSRRGFDPRPLRFEQGVIAFVLLIGFTFQAELLIPIVTAVLAVSGAVGPRRAPLPRLFSAVAGDRLEPPDAFVDRQTVRLSVLVQTSALVVAIGPKHVGGLVAGDIPFYSEVNEEGETTLLRDEIGKLALVQQTNR